MLYGILTGVLIYSFVLTIFVIYKDNSGYAMINELDIVFAGPVAWLLVLLVNLISPFIRKKKKKYEYKNKSQRYIKKVVGKIIRKYKKSKGKRKEYFDFQSHRHGYEYDPFGNDISGWDDLMIKHWRNEWINNKFERLMFNQKQDTINELLKYFTEVTDYDSVDVFSQNTTYELKQRETKIYTL